MKAAFITDNKASSLVTAATYYNQFYPTKERGIYLKFTFDQLEV